MPNCELHNVNGCSSCFTPEGCCDFGSCCNAAKFVVDYRNAKYAVIDSRPMCRRHAEADLKVSSLRARISKIL